VSAPNIILVVADTVRADHLSAYGYARPTSPRFDSLAAEGTLFEELYVNHFPTVPSFTTLYSGTDACEHRIVQQTFGPWYELDAPLLAERLRGAGYLTAAVDNIVTQKTSLNGWFARGFMQYLGFRYDPTDERQARWITNRALMVMERARARQPFFLLLHYWDAHAPYWPPSDTPTFEIEPIEPGKPTLVDRFMAEGDEDAALSVRGLEMPHVTNYDFIVAQYDRSIWNVDRELGRLVEGLKKHGLEDSTALIVTADHGEAFGEFGVHFDHAGPSDANMHVPLVIRWPGTVPSRVRMPGFFNSLDINATVLAMAGLSPSRESDGRDLLDSPKPREFVISAECTRQSNWILRTHDFKLVDPSRDPETGALFPDLMGRPRSGPTLHDVRDPARESIDVSAMHPAETERLVRQLRSWLESRLRGRPDPLAIRPEPFEKMIERARASVDDPLPPMPWNKVIQQR
jgi:arylsulfatase A-like enzyme